MPKKTQFPSWTFLSWSILQWLAQQNDLPFGIWRKILRRIATSRSACCMHCSLQHCRASQHERNIMTALTWVPNCDEIEAEREKGLHSVHKVSNDYDGITVCSDIPRGSTMSMISRSSGQTRVDTHTQQWDTTHRTENDTPIPMFDTLMAMLVTYSGTCVESYPRDTVPFRLIRPQWSLFGLSENQMWCVTAELAIMSNMNPNVWSQNLAFNGQVKFRVIKFIP